MHVKKIISMWALGAIFATAALAQAMPAPSRLHKSKLRLGKSRGNHRGSTPAGTHKVKRGKH